MGTAAAAEKAPAPEWVESVRRKYLGGEATVFLLYGNVYDQVLHEDRWLPLQEYLARELLASKRTVQIYDPSVGVFAPGQERPPPGGEQPTLEAMEETLFEKDGVGALIKYVDTIAPAGDEVMLSPNDRMAAVRLHRWSLSGALAAKDNIVFLLAESLTTVNAKLVSNPRIAAVEVPLPDSGQREAAIRKLHSALPQGELRRLAAHTSGLKAVHLQQILAPKAAVDLNQEERRAFIAELLKDKPDQEARTGQLLPLTAGMGRAEIKTLIQAAGGTTGPADDEVFSEVLQLVAQRKREILERECGGMLKFLDSPWGLEAVGGVDGVREELQKVAKNLRGGDPSLSPMGILVVGAMGTGKSFLTQCFARSAGIPAVALSTFMSKWVGSTEANLEKVLTTVKAMAPIILAIDEVDRSVANSGSGENDGGTASRVQGRLKEFMGDPVNRGQVLCVLMTNRPDRLDADMKRAGRCDIKIPLFYPSEVADIKSVIAALMRRHGIKGTFDAGALARRLTGYSNGEIEAVLLLAHTLAPAGVDDALLGQAVDDYLPSRDAPMIEYMELLACFEASRRSLLPERYRRLTPDELHNRLETARARCGRRAA